MELRHIRYFVRAAEMLHFTNAAESLYISQPTLSNHIQQLEEEVGLPLFNRLGRHVRLTEAGQIFLEHASKTLKDLERAKEEIDDLKGVMTGTVRITSLLGLGQSILPAWIASFHNTYPLIHFETRTGTSQSIEADVKSGNVDLGFAFIPIESRGLVSELLISHPMCLVVSEKHKLANKKSIDLRELSNVPLALVGRRFSLRLTIDSLLEEMGLSLKIIVEMDDVRALLKLAGEGDLGALLTPLAVADYPGVKAIPIKGLAPIDVGVIWHSDGRLSPPAKAFLQYIRQQCLAMHRTENGGTGSGGSLVGSTKDGDG